MSSSVRSGSAAIRSSSHCSCLFSGERQWPVPGLASTLPVVVQRSIQRIAVEAPTLSRRAASRALSPASTIETTRSRRSFEYPFAIAYPRRCRRKTESDFHAQGNPYNPSDSDQAGTALGCCWKGALLIKRGELDHGLPLLRSALKDLREVRFAFYHAGFLGALAEGYASAGQFEAAHDAIDEALERCKQKEELWCIAELLRIK